MDLSGKAARNKRKKLNAKMKKTEEANQKLKKDEDFDAEIRKAEAVNKKPKEGQDVPANVTGRHRYLLAFSMHLKTTGLH